MKRRSKKKVVEIKKKAYGSRRVGLKKVMVSEAETGHIIERIYRTNSITGKSTLCRETRIDTTTGKRRVIYNKGTNIPGPDHFPPMPGGAKPPKPVSGVPKGKTIRRKTKSAKYGKKKND